MIPKHFKKQRNSIKQKFRERKKLLKPLLKLYGKPVLVHSVHDSNVFYTIIKEGKLKLPINHSSLRKTPLMEKLLKIDNCIYYSLGFVYLTSYDWNYNLLFDVGYLKDLIYYRKGIHFKAYRLAVDYWYQNDKAYLEKLATTNNLTRKVIDTYYYKRYNGEVRKILEFWKIEKELYRFIQAYSKKKELLALIRRLGKEYFLPYPYSERDALEVHSAEWAPEIVGKKENNLLKNPYFLGFCITGKPPQKIIRFLRQKYSDKIIFDGNKVRRISDLQI